MCGIYGYFNRGRPFEREILLTKMANSIAHRGPDDRGSATSEDAAIGSVRLSIIDIESGHQPMQSDNGAIRIVQNGEIYNYVELRKELEKKGINFQTQSDTEVLLRLYEAEGIMMLRRLNGMFAIAIHDLTENRLILARDRLGVKPLYIHDNRENVFFSSEIKALLQCGIDRQPHFRALRYFADLGYVPPHMSAFQGIEPVPPGAYVEITKTGSKTIRWWTLENAPSEIRDESQWAQNIKQHLDDAVRLRLRADVPFGLFLSGGIDSSTVTSLASRAMASPLKSFTISFPDPAYDESGFAKLAAQRFKTDHHCERVTPDILNQWPRAIFHADQPHSDSSFLPVWRVASLAAQHVKMVLTGDGGDELFAGYDKYRTIERMPNFKSGKPVGIAQAWLQVSRILTVNETLCFTPEFLEASQDSHTLELLQNTLGQCDQMDPINQVLFLDTALLLPGNNLIKPDRMAMAVGLETRSPFLDCHLVETAFKIPGDLKLKNGRTKHILKRAVKSIIGRDLAERRKQQFTMPVGDWVRDESSSLAKQLLLSDRCLDRGIFRPEFLRTIVTEHIQRSANHTQLIRSLISLEIWFRTFIENLYERPPLLEEIL